MTYQWSGCACRGSLRPHDTSDSDPVDEKEDVPLINPESAAAEAVKNLKIGGEEWNYKVSGNMGKATCGE